MDFSALFLIHKQFNVLILLQNNMRFCFEEYNVTLKLGIVRLIADWSKSESTASILYDSKFVQLLIYAIFPVDKIVANNFEKKQMSFIKSNSFKSTIFLKSLSESSNFIFFSYDNRCIYKTCRTKFN